MIDAQDVLDRAQRATERVPLPDHDFGALVRRHEKQRRSQRLAAASVALLVVTAAFGLIAGGISNDGLVPAHEPDNPAAEIDVPGSPSGIAEANGLIWVSTYEGAMYAIDPATNAIVDTIQVQLANCGDLVVSHGSLWVSFCAHWGGDGSVEIDPATGDKIGSSPADSLVFGGGRAWGFEGGAIAVWELDPSTGQVRRPLKGYGFALGYAFHSLWLVGDRSDVVRLDPQTGREIGTYHLPSDMGAFAEHGKGGGFISAGGYVWLTAYRGWVYGGHVSEGALYRLDPRSGSVEQILPLSLDPWMSHPTGMSIRQGAWVSPGPEVYLDAHAGVVWVAQTPSTVVGIDAHTGAIVGSYAAQGQGTANVLATSDSLWIANFRDGSVWRYDLPPTG